MTSSNRSILCYRFINIFLKLRLSFYLPIFRFKWTVMWLHCVCLIRSSWFRFSTLCTWSPSCNIFVILAQKRTIWLFDYILKGVTCTYSFFFRCNPLILVWTSVAIENRQILTYQNDNVTEWFLKRCLWADTVIYDQRRSVPINSTSLPMFSSGLTRTYI